MDSKADQEDLQQEIIYQLWKSFPRFKGDSKFSTWMYRVALNTAITFYKKDLKRLDKQNGELDINNATFTVEEHGTKDLQLRHFYQAIKKLNKIERALILLFIEGNSHQEIGHSLGLSEGNARVKLSRTKVKLQEIIKNQGYEF
jgi:RNA polymerase sigma-70 factor (ECF subfamily)